MHYPLSITHYLRERGRLQVGRGEAGFFADFGGRHGAAGDGAGEEIEQSLGRGRIVELVAGQHRLRRFADKIPETRGLFVGAFEKKGVNRAVAGDQLRRMEVPALVKTVDQRMRDVVVMPSPGVMDGAFVFGLFFFRELAAAMDRDGHLGRHRIRETQAERRQPELHELAREPAGVVLEVLVRGRDAVARRVIVGAEMRRRDPVPAGRDELAHERDGRRRFDHDLEA